MRVLAWPAHKNSDRNPYQHLLYRAMEWGGEDVVEFSPWAVLSVRRTSIFHIHWPDAFIAADAGIRFWMRLLSLRTMIGIAHLRGMKVIWTAHNFKREGQRNASLMTQWFWPWWVRAVDGVIYLSGASQDATLAQEPKLREVENVKIPHGSYRPITQLLSNPAFRPSGVPKVLYAGSLGRYKRPGSLVSAFGEAQAGAMRLTIAGEPSAIEPDLEFEPAVSRLSEAHRANLTLRLEFLSDQELVREIENADLVVFPYGPVLSSGAVLFALSVGRPVLTTAQPVFEELRSEVGDEWVWTCQGELTGAELLCCATRAAELRSKKALPDLSAREWPAIAEQTVEFYERVLGAQR